MRLCRAVLIAVLALPAGGALAQEQAPAAVQPMAVLTLDQDRLFSGSTFGRKTLETVERDARALQTENRRIEADLETEEQALTDQRATMAPADFRTAADAFDDKVKGIRTAQEAKARDLAQQRDAARQRFLQASAPILAEIMNERGAVAILDRAAIILSFDRADITDLAIERIDSVLAEPVEPDATTPVPDATPAPDVTPAPEATTPAPDATPAPEATTPAPDATPAPEATTPTPDTTPAPDAAAPDTGSAP